MNLKEQIKSMIDAIPENAPNIGIGITEHNRYDVFKHAYEEIKKYSPGCKIVVVDDASTKPVPESDFRFKENVGIARAKNKCFELLRDCEHIFLFDSDTYPISPDWWRPYVESPEPHLNYIFKDFSAGNKLNDTSEVYRDSKHIAYSHARGCMMYYHRSVLDKVGGMDPIFGKWGYEHPDLSNRIYMVGMTSFRYMDVVGSDTLIYSADEHRKVVTTVGGAERTKCIAANKAIYDSRIFSSHYVPFIEKQNIILTCYFTGVVDTQRGSKWAADINALKPLADSVKTSKLVILHDCFDDVPKWRNVEFVRVETSKNPYIQRWISYREYLIKNRDIIGNVFCVDGTDVEILREPDWNLLGSDIWTGDENEVLGCQWMVNHHKPMLAWINQNKYLPVLNAGVMGGAAETVIEFIRQMIDYVQLGSQMGETDMALFNYIARTNWKVRSGRQVTTLFKGYEKDNKTAWFKHK